MPTRFDWVGLPDDAFWPSAEWEITTGTAAGTLDVQNERGRFETASANRARRCIMQDTDVDISLADAEIDSTFEFMAGATGTLAVSFTLRGDGLWVNDGFGPNEILPNNGYVVRIYSDGRMWVRRMVNGASTNFVNGIDQGSSVGPDIVTRIRFQVEGDVLRWKVWAPAGESEPAWSTDTDTQFSSGICATGAGTGTTSSGEVRWDYVDLYDISAAAGTALDTPVVTIDATTNPTTVGGTDGTADASWVAITGAATYRVEIAPGLNATTGFTVLAESHAATSYQATGLAAGDHTIAVTAKP